MKHRNDKKVFDIFFLLFILSYLIYCIFKTVAFGMEAQGMARVPFIFIMVLIYILVPFLASQLVVYVSLRKLLFQPDKTKMRMVLWSVVLVIGLICLAQSAVWVFGEAYF